MKKKIQIIPLGNQILVEHVKEEQIVGENTRICAYGKVVAIGEEVTKVKVGDTIGHTIWGTNSLEIGENVYRFVPEDNQFLLCIIKNG